jgi:hypothetical protein
MSNKKIQSILKDVLEKKVPSSQIDLWPAVKADLVAGNYLNQQGDKMNTQKSHRSSRLYLAISLSLALLIVLFVTPQGRTFAQSVVEFFTRAESTTYPLEDHQIAQVESEPNTATAEPPMPLISVAEAEAQVGFNISELPFVPEGFEYLGARLYGNHVSIEYQVENGGGHLTIMQSQEGYYQSNWDNVPADAVVPVKVGEYDGEFVQGVFVVYPEETNATWNPDASIMRLRWVANGVWFEITKYGDVHSIEYLDMAELIEIAEYLSIQP